MGHGSVVVNKVLPMHDKAHWSVHCWWLLSPHNDRVECNRGCMAHRAYNICYLAFYQKKFADPSFRPVSLSLSEAKAAYFSLLCTPQIHCYTTSQTWGPISLTWMITTMSYPHPLPTTRVVQLKHTFGCYTVGRPFLTGLQHTGTSCKQDH